MMLVTTALLIKKCLVVARSVTLILPSLYYPCIHVAKAGRQEEEKDGPSQTLRALQFVMIIIVRISESTPFPGPSNEYI